MRRLAAACLLFALAAAARADGVQFVRVWPGWRSEDAFARIPEYFGRTGDQKGWPVRRTHADQRAGYYFLVRVAHPEVDLQGAAFRLQIIKPDSPEPQAFSFPAGVGRGTDVFRLGLTGADWAGKKVHPVAWKLELLTADGRPLASAESFLWAKPQGKP